MTVIWIATAFALGVLVGVISLATPTSGSERMSREEASRMCELMRKAAGNRESTVTLWCDGVMLDSVTFYDEHYPRRR